MLLGHLYVAVAVFFVVVVVDYNFVISVSNMEKKSVFFYKVYVKIKKFTYIIFSLIT